MAGRPPVTFVSGSGTVPGSARSPGGLPLLAAVAAARAALRCPGPGYVCRNAAGDHAGPCGRRTPTWGGRMGAAGGLRRRRHRGRTTGRVQPARPGLEPATVATGPAGGRGLPTVPGPGRSVVTPRGGGPGRPHPRAVPVVVDPLRAVPRCGRLCLLRPRRAAWHPRPGGPPFRRGRRRRGSGHGRAHGTPDTARPRDPGHLDPVVRTGRGRRSAAPGTMAPGLPGLGCYPRPPADARLPGRRPRAAA